MDQQKGTLAVVGTTGYVGGRLVPRLLAAGYRVRAIGRSLAKLRGRSWAGHPAVEFAEADVLQPESLESAMRGVAVLYYLVHSMSSPGRDFEGADRAAARHVAAAATAAGIARIIYLGGLGEDHPGLSRHLRSRAEVARLLQSGPVPVTVLRAAMIIGSGSASFEILRYLVERLPVMITPRWIDTPCQPIAIRNVLTYLISCLECPESVGRTFDIGQPHIVTYRELMTIYAEEAGLHRRLILPVPVLTPRLSSYWIHLVTPVPASLARPLAEGLANPVLCQENRLATLIPQPLLDCRIAIRLALERLRQQQVESSWTDAGNLPPAEWGIDGDPCWAGGTLFRDGRRMLLASSPALAWAAVIRIGGATGWYYANWLWSLRGAVDRLLGGVGLRRGRRDGAVLQVGDALDFWRVAAVEVPRRLLLVAEMKVPGEASLEFILRPAAEGTELRQVARFRPRGLWGLLYWWLVTPFHGLVFSGMLRGLAQALGERPLRGPERLQPDDGGEP
jgi:uncharacterized protein YbjT (DUF2867 family)